MSRRRVLEKPSSSWRSRSSNSLSVSEAKGLGCFGAGLGAASQGRASSRQIFPVSSRGSLAQRAAY